MPKTLKSKKMSYLAKAQKLCQLMEEGKSMEAFEELYHEDVVVVEATGETRKGKAVQRAAIQEWFSSVVEMHGSGFGAITANEETGTTIIESWVDLTTKNGRMKLEEVGVQKWKDGQIIHERFYYNIPGQ